MHEDDNKINYMCFCLDYILLLSIIQIIVLDYVGKHCKNQKTRKYKNSNATDYAVLLS